MQSQVLYLHVLYLQVALHDIYTPLHAVPHLSRRRITQTYSSPPEMADKEEQDMLNEEEANHEGEDVDELLTKHKAEIDKLRGLLG